MPAPAAVAAGEAAVDDPLPQLPRKRRRLHNACTLPGALSHCEASRAAAGSSQTPAPVVYHARYGSIAEAMNCSTNAIMPLLPSERRPHPTNSPDEPDQHQHQDVWPLDEPEDACRRDDEMHGSDVHGDPPCSRRGLPTESREAAQQHCSTSHSHEQATAAARESLGDADLALLARLGAPAKPLPPEGNPEMGLRRQSSIDGLSRPRTTHTLADSAEAEAAVRLPSPDGQCSQLEVTVCLARF